MSEFVQKKVEIKNYKADINYSLKFNENTRYLAKHHIRMQSKDEERFKGTNIVKSAMHKRKYTLHPILIYSSYLAI